jgi:hypothetical protein
MFLLLLQMSLLGKQVYANPTTPIWGQGGGGGGGSYPLDASFNSVSFLPPGDPAPYASSKLRLSSVPYGDAYLVGVVDPSNDLGPLQTGGYVEVQDAGPLSTAFSRMLYAWDGIDYQQANSGTSVEFMSLNSGSNGFDLSNVSTINGSPPGGGSYPRDASFNSIRIDPSGGVPPLTIGLGGTSTILGIRRIEGGVETDYITFAPASSEMDLSNVSTINGSAYPPPAPAPTYPSNRFTLSNNAGASVLAAGTPVVGIYYEPPANGRVYANAVCSFTLGSNVSPSATLAVAANLVVSDLVSVPDVAEGNTSASVQWEFGVQAGTAYDFVATATAGRDGDFTANAATLFISFIPS